MILLAMLTGSIDGHHASGYASLHEVLPGLTTIDKVIFVGGQPSLIMQGYYAMPEATLEAFRNLWFHTGDVLKRDGDGYFYFIGRRKDMVRRRGENISAAEVEMAIEAHPDVLACAVIGVPSDMTEEEVMACVVLRPGATLETSAALELAGQVARACFADADTAQRIGEFATRR